MDTGLLHCCIFEIAFLANNCKFKLPGVLRRKPPSITRRQHSWLPPARQRFSVVSSLHLDKTKNLTIESAFLFGLANSLSSYYRKPSWCNSLWWNSAIIINEPSSIIGIQLYSYKIVTRWYEKVPYVHRTTIQDNILPRGGPIQDPLPPLLEVVSPQYKVIQQK